MLLFYFKLFIFNFTILFRCCAIVHIVFTILRHHTLFYDGLNILLSFSTWCRTFPCGIQRCVVSCQFYHARRRVISMKFAIVIDIYTPPYLFFTDAGLISGINMFERISIFSIFFQFFLFGTILHSLFHS